MFGGVRFGGTLTIDSAFELGFDHVALCAGAGRPTVIPMKNGLARGVRQASDFLMALQLTGAAKTNSVANLQLRMPIVVIGGGLTAIDTATESLAYYVVQVEKFLERYETLAAEKGEREVRAGWTRGRGRDRRRVPGARLRDSRGTRPGGARRPRSRADRAAQLLGRRHHRLPPAPDRCAQLHAEPRGSGARRSRKASASPSALTPRGSGSWIQYGHAAALHVLKAAIAASACACPRGRFWSPPERSRIRCWHAKTRTTSSWTANGSRRWTKTASQ